MALPAATDGTPPYAYRVQGLPDGMSFASGTRRVTGTPFGRAGTRTLSFSVNDAAGSSASMEIPVTLRAAESEPEESEPEPLAFEYAVRGQEWTTGQQIPQLVLPRATGGTPPCEYSVSGLPDDLFFSPTPKTISGTPTEPAGTWAASYSVRDAAGQSASTALSITLHPLALAASSAFQQVSAGRHHNTCGVRANGAVECWGKDADGRTSPPAVGTE